MLTALIEFTAGLITWLIIIYVLLSFIVPPYNAIRIDIERLVAPMLNPIRRRVPPSGTFDFSPLILIISVQLLAGILIQITS